MLSPIVSRSTPPSDSSPLLVARRLVGECIHTDPTRWREAVHTRDPVRLLHVEGVVNRAFFKMLELSSFVPVPPKRVALLCEAPGGFLQCATRIWPEATFHAHSMFGEGCIPFHPSLKKYATRPLPRGGDVCEAEVVSALCRTIGSHSVDLVTADGGKEIKDLDREEELCLPLLLHQVSACLLLQRKGGTAIVKMFEGSTRAVRDTFDVLKDQYQSVYLYKPRTSKVANAERYAIAVSLKDETRAREVAHHIQTTANRAARERKCVTQLLPCPSIQTERAFQSLSAKQVTEIHRLLRNDREELASLAREDVLCIMQHCSSRTC